jgi:hypothetical protein
LPCLNPANRRRQADDIGTHAERPHGAGIVYAGDLVLHLSDRRDGVIGVDALGIGTPVGFLGCGIGRRALQPAAIEIHHVPGQSRIVGQDAPRQRVVALPDTEKAAERHDGIGHLPIQLVQHQRIDRSEFLALTVIDRGAYDFVGLYQVEGLIRGDRAARNCSVFHKTLLVEMKLERQSVSSRSCPPPPNVHCYALLPIGYPMGRFGPVRRVALADVVYEDQWGRTNRD